MKKRKTSPTDDRISALPDPIIAHILSFLNMKKIVRTSVLSRRWQYLWTFVPNLTFKHVRKRNIEKFVTWVTKTLFCLWGSKIDKLKIKFIYKSCFASDVNLWVKFALEKKVRNLILDFDFDSSDDDYYLPQHIYCNSSLVKLSIKHCQMVPRGVLSWKCLESLTISSINLSDNMITQILSGSPMLKYLKLYNCWGMHSLDLTSNSLRTLVIDTCLDKSTLEISAPNLLSLHLLGKFSRHFRLINVSSLVQAELNFSFTNDDGHDYIIRDNQCAIEFFELMESLRHVVQLKMGLHCIQAIILEDKFVMSHFLKLERLTLNVTIDQNDVPGIISLLKLLPNLQQLVVNKRLCDSQTQTIAGPLIEELVEKFWNSERKIEKFPLLYLKFVKFNGFKNWEVVNKFTLKLGEVLLENAELVEKIVLVKDEFIGKAIISTGEKQVFINRVA